MRTGVQIPGGFIRTCHNEVSRVTSSVIVGATAQYKCLQSRTHKLMRPKDLIFIVRYALYQ